MDPATIAGILIAVGALYAMITMEGAHVSALLLPAPMILVFGAAIGAAIASGTLKDALAAAKALPRAFLAKPPKMQGAIDQVTAMAELARAEGLLSLERQASEAKDPFWRDALQSVADGTDSDDLRELLEDRIIAKKKDDAVAVKFFMDTGGYAPTVGIVGTVVSLTHVLENLAEPDKLGPMVAAAFVATLWGLMSANFIWLPIGHRLKRISALEVASMQILMEGALAVQGGSQPRVVAERLSAMLPATKSGKSAKTAKAA